MIYFFTGIFVFSGWILSPAPTLATPGPETGKALFIKKCQPCHGERGDGKTFAANVLDPPPKNFTSPQTKKKLTIERMIRSVTQGRPGTAMMPWKDVLSPDDINAVVHYIRKELMGMEETTDEHR
ncbi:MAG: cytochrome c [Nitrospinaceae bacterium]